jgi:hypothetical protein
MPQKISPWVQGKFGWDYGENGWNGGADENFVKFSFLFDRNVDAIVATVPTPTNGLAYFNTTDNQFYFSVNGTYYTSPVPKNFVFYEKLSGQAWLFTGTSLVQVDNPVETDSRLDAVDTTVSSLGSAAFQSSEYFASSDQLDVSAGQSAAYTDQLRTDLASTTGSELVGFKLDGVASAIERTIIKKSSDVWHVKDFGAVGDGVTNDTDAIQLAIDTAAAQPSKPKLTGVGGVYVVRELLCKTGVDLQDFDFLQLIESTTHTSPWLVLKAVLKFVEVSDILCTRISVDGRRGQQNIDAAGTDDGGCHAFQIRASQNITLIDCSATMMATDCLAMDPYTAGGPVRNKNIKLIRPNFTYARRNNISILDCEGMLIEGGYIGQSGLVVAGAASGASIIYIGETPWSAPGIDIEPENNWKISDLVIRDTIIDGCRSGLMILENPGKTGTLVQSVVYDNVTIKNPVSGKFFEISGADGNRIHDITCRDVKIHGDGFVNLWAGQGVRLDGVESFSSTGVRYATAFATVGGGQQQTLGVRSVINNLRCSRVSIGAFGLNTAQFGSVAQALAAIRFDSSCRVSATQSSAANLSVRGRDWLPTRPVAKSRTRVIPVFSDNAQAALREPVLYTNESTYLAPVASDSYKIGFLGWVPYLTTTRTVADGSSGGTLKVTSGASAAEDVGAVIAVQYVENGNWYHGVVTGVTDGTTYTVEPSLTSAPAAGLTMTLTRIKDAYAIKKQPNQVDTTATTVAGLVADVNALLAKLRAANVLGDS